MSTVKPDYCSIEAVRDICQVWIDLWSGDEWGEVMRGLLDGSITDYGISDDDCAAVAEIMLRNVIEQYPWMISDGVAYGLHDPERHKEAQAECRRLRDYWREGGNLRGEHAAQVGSETVNALPAWMFGT